MDRRGDANFEVLLDAGHPGTNVAALAGQSPGGSPAQGPVAEAGA